MDDPAYDVWFLAFKKGADGRGATHHQHDGTYHNAVCDNNFKPPKCTDLFHMITQTPGYPSGDGNCNKPCDCGRLPCGFYLFDQRQAHTAVNGQTLLEYLVAQRHRLAHGPALAVRGRFLH